MRIWDKSSWIDQSDIQMIFQEEFFQRRSIVNGYLKTDSGMGGFKILDQMGKEISTDGDAAAHLQGTHRIPVFDLVFHFIKEGRDLPGIGEKMLSRFCYEKAVGDPVKQFLTVIIFHFSDGKAHRRLCHKQLSGSGGHTSGITYSYKNFHMLHGHFPNLLLSFLVCVVMFQYKQKAVFCHYFRV